MGINPLGGTGIRFMRISAITVAFLAVSAHAELDLSPQLVHVGDTVEGDLSIDMNSLVWEKSNKVLAWVLLAPSANNEARKVGASFIRLRAHIDCSIRRYYFSTWVAFKADGTTLGRGDFAPPEHPHQPVPPNALRNRLIAIACQQK